MYLIIGIIGIFSVQNTWAGSAGGRGGGTGVICAGETSPVTLEQFQLQSQVTTHELPLDRSEILPWLKKRLARPQLYRKVQAAWSEIGPYDSWPEISGDEVTHALVDASSTTLLDQFNRVLGKLPWHDGTTEETSPSDLVGDDYFRVPPGCRKVQLSLIAEGKAKRVSGFEITETTKRFLELHEAIYQVGMNEYRHHVARRTRDMIVAIHGGDSSEVTAATRRFMKTESSKKHWYGRLSGLFVLSGLKAALDKNLKFESSGALETVQNHTAPVECPVALSFSPDSTDRSEITALRIDFTKLPLTLRAETYRTEMMTFRKSAHTVHVRGLKILLDESATWFKDHTPTFHFADYFFDSTQVLRLSAVPAELSSPYPFYQKTSNGRTEIRDYEGCSYVRLDLQTELDGDEVMKIWNSFILSRYGRSDR